MRMWQESEIQALLDETMRYREERDSLREQLETLRGALRGIAHAEPPAKGTPAQELAHQLAAARLAARVVLDEWGPSPASTSSEGQGNQRQSERLTSRPDPAASLPDPEESSPAEGPLA